MELRPVDLGESYQSAIVLRRSRGKSTTAASNKRKRIDPWVRRTVASLNLTPTVEQDTLSAVSTSTRTIPLGMALISAGIMVATAPVAAPAEVHMALLAGPAALAFLGGLILRRGAVQEIYKRPLRETEIAYLRPTIVKESQPRWIETHVPIFLRDMLPPRPEIKTPATLESDYFDLVASILRLPEPDLNVREELRDTVHQIGDAVAAIRRSEIEEERVEARDLIGDAEMLAARARSEPDQVIAGSFLRQARAKVAQAKVVDGNVMLRRRTRALDAELRAQIAATRSTLRNLSSQGTMSLESNGAFRTIANSVRTLATEATSVNAARDELAAALRGDDVPVAAAISAATEAAQTTPRNVVTRSVEVEQPATLRNGRSR